MSDLEMAKLEDELRKSTEENLYLYSKIATLENANAQLSEQHRMVCNISASIQNERVKICEELLKHGLVLKPGPLIDAL